MSTNVKAVIFDWAGTTVDYGSFAPVAGFVEGFRKIGFEITNEMARKPMGLLKIDHTRAIAAMIDAPISEEQILEAYAAFEETLFANIADHCELKDHVLDVVAQLRDRGLAIGSTTGYTVEMMERVVPAAAAQGYIPDHWVAPDASLKGRPFPFLIWENLKRFGIADPRLVVKVGDTVADIDEGRAANTWTVGVVLGSSELGLTRDEVAALTDDELAARKAEVRATYYRAGADFVIDDLDELPAVVDAIDARLAQNAQHLLLTPGPLTTRASVKAATLTDHCTWDEEYKGITRGVLAEITDLAAGTAADEYATVLLQGSGSYAVESMITCLAEPEGKILFLVNGEYGKRMLTIAEAAGRDFDAIVGDETRAFDPALLEARLRESDDVATVVFVHCETTTGVLNPLEELARIAKAHGKRVLVDAMSSFGAYDIDLPALGIDALASSANKCLEGLPGLAFVVARRDLIEGSKGVSTSHSLDLHDQYLGLYAGGGKFRFTSPTTILLALQQAIEDYRAEGGLAARRARYQENHRVLVEGLTALGIEPLVPAGEQSHIITTFALGDLDFTVLYGALKERGFVIYPGKLTTLPTFRIGNIGNVFPGDMARLVDAIAEVVAA